jgi:hypothetical protein
MQTCVKILKFASLKQNFFVLGHQMDRSYQPELIDNRTEHKWDDMWQGKNGSD